MSWDGRTGFAVCESRSKYCVLFAGDLATFMGWVDSVRRLGVLANADTPADAAVARKNGAGGIGLTRTEHMFFSSPARIAAIRRMIGAMELGAGSGRWVPASFLFSFFMSGGGGVHPRMFGGGHSRAEGKGGVHLGVHTICFSHCPRTSLRSCV
jgi:hypothetical protein